MQLKGSPFRKSRDARRGLRVVPLRASSRGGRASAPMSGHLFLVFQCTLCFRLKLVYSVTSLSIWIC